MPTTQRQRGDSAAACLLGCARTRAVRRERPRSHMVALSPGLPNERIAPPEQRAVNMAVPVTASVAAGSPRAPESSLLLLKPHHPCTNGAPCAPERPPYRPPDWPARPSSAQDTRRAFRSDGRPARRGPKGRRQRKHEGGTGRVRSAAHAPRSPNGMQSECNQHAISTSARHRYTTRTPPARHRVDVPSGSGSTSRGHARRAGTRSSRTQGRSCWPGAAGRQR